MKSVAEEKDKLQEENLTKDTDLETEESSSPAEDGNTGDAAKETQETKVSDKAEGKEEKKDRKKKEKTDKKQEALKEKIEELEDRVKRQMAEFENFRKRTEKEKTAMFETGARSVIEKMLPVVDNFERGLAAVPEGEKDGAFAQGMEMIYKQLMTEFANMEVKPIPAVGEEFNPDFHNAVMQVDSEEFGSGVIAQELQKGYTYRDSVVRYSMVAVVKE